METLDGVRPDQRKVGPMNSMDATTEEMSALVLSIGEGGYTDGRGFQLQKVPAPQLDEVAHPDDAHRVILHSLYTGFCGSDRGLWYRNAFGDSVTRSLERDNKNWRVPGHEYLGRVAAVGSKVTQVAVGDVVAAESHLFCDECYQCLRGERHVCANQEILGFTCDGGFAEQVKLPARVLWPTNLEAIRPEVAVLQEPFGNAVHACSKVSFEDQTVLISGCGTIGLFSVLVAKQLGAKTVIGIDPDPSKCELAKRCGADQVISPTLEKIKGAYQANPKVIEEIMDLTAGIGVDVAMEMAGFNVSVNHVIQAVRRGGDVILFGIKSGDFTVQNFDNIIVDGITLHAIIGRRLFETWELSQKLLEEHPEKIQNKIFDVILDGGRETVFDFSSYSIEAMEEALNTQTKVLVKFGDSV